MYIYIYTPTDSEERWAADLEAWPARRWAHDEPVP